MVQLTLLLERLLFCKLVRSQFRVAELERHSLERQSCTTSSSVLLPSGWSDWHAFNIIRLSSWTPVGCLCIKGLAANWDGCGVFTVSLFSVKLMTLWTVCQSAWQMNVSFSVRSMPRDHVKSMFYSSPQCLCHWHRDRVTEIYCAVQMGGVGSVHVRSSLCTWGLHTRWLFLSSLFYPFCCFSSWQTELVLPLL